MHYRCTHRRLNLCMQPLRSPLPPRENLKSLISAGRGAEFVPIGILPISWKTFPTKTTKMLSTRNSRIVMIRVQVFETECFCTKYLLKRNLCICEGVSSLVRNGCIKDRTIKKLDACYMVEIRRLQMFYIITP